MEDAKSTFRRLKIASEARRLVHLLRAQPVANRGGHQALHLMPSLRLTTTKLDGESTSSREAFNPTHMNQLVVLRRLRYEVRQ